MVVFNLTVWRGTSERKSVYFRTLAEVLGLYDHERAQAENTCITVSVSEVKKDVDELELLNRTGYAESSITLVVWEYKVPGTGRGG